MRGIDLEGNKGIVFISRERRMHLACSTLTYIHKKWSGRQFSSLLDLWSGILQLRRPGYAALGVCFKIFNAHYIHITKYIPIAAKMELIMLALLAQLWKPIGELTYVKC